MTSGGIEIAALALERGSTLELAALPPCPANLVGDRGALKPELDREREIALPWGLSARYPSTCASPRGEARLSECTE